MNLRDLYFYNRSKPTTGHLPVVPLAFAVALAVANMSPLALAGDLLPQSRVDASGTGAVPVAAPLKAGYSKATLHGESTLYKSSDVSGANSAALERSNRFDALAGTSLAKGLDLHLGVHGTYERDGEISSRRVSGGSLMIKANVVSVSAFNLALAPYLESGIGSKGNAVETRAVRARGGVMLIAGFNRKNAYEWNLAIGNRNRASEQFDGISFGHESIYKTSIKFNVTNDFGFTAAGDGRQIQVQRDDEAKKAVFGTGRGQLGAFARFGNVEASVYGGASIDRAVGKKLWKSLPEIGDLDGGPLFFGAAISMSVGQGVSTRNAEPIRDYDSNAVETEARIKKAKKSSVMADESTEPVSYDNNFLKDFSGSSAGGNRADDFSAAEAAIQKLNTVPPGSYDIDSVEREIAQLRETEKKADEARAKAEEIRAEKEHSSNAKTAEERAKLMRQMRKDVQADVDALPSNSAEDVSWHGLE